MKIKNKVNFLIIFLCLINLAFAVDLNEYEYVTSINVNCEEYEGYARFELPDEYLQIISPKAYMNTDFSIQEGFKGEEFIKNRDWYIKSIDDLEISEIEKIYDMNFNSYLVVSQANQLVFNFDNPNLNLVEKISIDVKDSQLNEIKIFDRDNQELNFVLNKDKFHYELIFDNPINLDFLKFDLKFDDVLKIREISFYDKKNYETKAFVYFYVDNNCNNTFNFYYGNFGKSYQKSGSKNLPIEFDTLAFNQKNNLYVLDFDNDTILNHLDNCLNVPNTNQKDINYNKIGDACEDSDNDRIVNLEDNCPDNRNYNQLDDDKDGIGNVCDENDDRFIEENKYLVYVLAGFIAIFFIFITIRVMRK